MAAKLSPVRAPEVAPAETRSIRDLAAADLGVLRFITCGSVDDGKSTLIGRLLYDTKLIFEDQLASLKKDSARHGTQGRELDFALLLDGLEAEREQGITIDVAYRFFATERRKFIVADTPGHEQYTRNMATGASTADLAVILVDARKGVLTQTRRHTYIANLIGVRHIVVAVNKMDLVDFDQARFDEIVAEYRALAEGLSFQTITPIPMSALQGDNVIQRSEAMPWYDGPALLQHLETIDVAGEGVAAPFRMGVQWVNRPNLDFRGFSGTVAAGEIRPGDPVLVTRSGKVSTVKALVTADGDLPVARTGDAVTLQLTEEIDASRGEVFASPEDRPEVANQFAANVIWMSEEPLVVGQPYLLKIGSQTVQASVSELRHKVDINTLSRTSGHELALNEIGECSLTTNQPIVFDAYARVREMGAFILIDRFTSQTVAAGMIEFSLSRATNVHRHAMDVSKATRAVAKGQKPVILWFTGLSGAGKSTIANLVEKKLAALGAHTYALDGDNLRHGLNKDLGFSDADRVENIRRIGEVAKLFVDAGLIVTASFISPFRADRQIVRDLVEGEEFIEIFVDAPLETCIERDPKGLYRKAKAGEIRNFTGIDSPYEAPVSPELRLDAGSGSAEALAEQVIDHLRRRGVVGRLSDAPIDFSI